LQPLAGRRIWLVGIGGAGMSALATVAKAWGADVAGSDRARSAYVDLLEAQGIRVAIGHAAENVPAGWEVVASGAIAPDNPEVAAGARHRAELLAELVALRPSIVVAGAHGKTTTAAMIAFVLERLGRNPAFLVGGTVPQLGGNARPGSGWLVAEGDESDRSLLLLRPRVAVITNIDLDHHATFASVAEVEELYDRWIALLPQDAAVVRGGQTELPDDIGLAVPGDHNRLNAASALAALSLAGVAPEDALPALAEFRGAGRRFELRGEVGGVRVVDDYAHHPRELAATLAAARREAGGGKVLVLFQPHLYSRTRHLAREFATALAAADAVSVTDVYAAREEPVEGVTGKLLVEALGELRPGMPLGWAPTVDAGARMIAARARPGDVLLAMGAGDVDRAVPLLLDLLAS
jgi:UDP-N-acetylmuramate--alanine ligase